jgi:hypothetical protein
MSLTKPPWRQRTQCISIPSIGRRYPPLMFYPHTHYQTHANGESNRVTGGANPRADLPPTQLMHSFYIILHARSFSGSVDRLLSGSRRSISGCITRLHSPSDSPSAIRLTIHHPICLATSYHPHFVASWIVLRPGWAVLNVGWVLREPTGHDSIPRPPEVPACVQVVAMLRLSSGLKWPRTATLSVIQTISSPPTCWVESQLLGFNAQLEIRTYGSSRGPWRVKPLELP